MFYDDLVNKKKSLNEYGKSVLTHFILTWNKGESMIFQMAKVEKYIAFGKQESIYFYAQVILTKLISEKKKSPEII
jgi:hypothetical protein